MDINDLILSDAAVDAIENGAWVGGFLDVPNVEVKVIGQTSQAYQKAMQSKLAAARSAANGKELSQDSIQNIIKEVLAETALLDWRGLTKDGKPFKFDRKTAEKWIKSTSGKRLADLVAAATHKLDTNASAFVEQATKN